jgi:hemerythrin
LPILWDPDLSVGVEAIDAQHRELFARIDRLLEALRERQGGAEVARLLHYLAEYVLAHFSSEEKLMLERAYPHYDAHRQEHLRFVRELEALRSEHDREGPTTVLLVRVTNRVTAWLREHIYRADRDLAAFLRDSGG